MSKYSSNLNALLHSQSHMLVFHIKLFLDEPQSSNYLNLHQHSSWFHFCFDLHFHFIHIYTHIIHVGLKILFHLPLTLKQILLHSYILLYLEHILEYMDHQ